MEKEGPEFFWNLGPLLSRTSREEEGRGHDQNVWRNEI
jgi:hypothetical protein